MKNANWKSGISLVLAGVAGAAFFWVTDPRYGPAMHRASEARFDWRYWLYVLRGSPDNLVDAANQAHFSSIVGIAGSVALLVVGAWLMSRKTV